LWDAHPRLGDRIVVIGAGTVGCLVAWLASSLRGAIVELVDVNPDRQAVAAALGVRFATPSTVTRDADLVIHASGSPSGLELACAVANVEATIVEMSWYGDQVVPLRLGEHFHVRRLSLKSSQVGTITPAQRPRWDSGRRMQLVMALLADPVLDALVTEESDFDELPSIMSRVATMPGASVCHRIRYSRSPEGE
jgi:threonine dehydrogenase-like Zn-dependent dehydrogenase